jgi:hypothetical protein
MRDVCSDRDVGRRVALERFTHDIAWNDYNGYLTLLARQPQVGNPEACFLLAAIETHCDRQILGNKTELYTMFHTYFTYF